MKMFLVVFVSLFLSWANTEACERCVKASPVPVQSECYQGNLIIATQEDLDAATEIECIDGNLTVHKNSDLQDVVFPALTEVNGAIAIVGRRPPANWQIAFPALEYSGPIRISANRKLVNVQFGFNMVSIESDFKFYSNPNCAFLSLGSLETVDGDLRIYSNNSLTSVQGLSLDTVGDLLEIEDNRELCQSSAESFADRIDYGSLNVTNNKTCH